MISRQKLSLLEKAASYVMRYRLRVVVACMIFFVIAAAWGVGVFSILGGGAGFDDPTSESAKANSLLQEKLGRYQNDVVVLYQGKDTVENDARFGDLVKSAASSIPKGIASRVETYWSTDSEDFVSKDRRTTALVIQLNADSDQEQVAKLRRIKDTLTLDDEGYKTWFGGVAAMTDQVNAQTRSDLIRAELISIPILLILLVIILGNVTSAMIPLLIGLFASITAMAVLRFGASLFDISSFAIQVTTILGLGLAIDYALLMVNRFREESEGNESDVAILHTMRTAGKTVLYSALAVAISFSGLLLFPSRFLQSMGIAGAVTAVLTAASATLLVPLLLSLFGKHIRRNQNNSEPITKNIWYKFTHAILNKPAMWVIISTAVLIIGSVPLLTANWGRPGEWVLPTTSGARIVGEKMDKSFTQDLTKTMTYVVEFDGVKRASSNDDALNEYIKKLSSVNGIKRVVVTNSKDAMARLTLYYSVDPQSRSAQEMVGALRSVTPPVSSKAYLTGMPASRVDIVEMITARLPMLLLFVAIVTFVVLLIALRSVTATLLSIALNVLSISASLGIVVLLFQNGLFGLQSSGVIDINFPVLIMAVVFGVAMDYQVFLVSRIREELQKQKERPGIKKAIAIGSAHTTRVIMSAALLLLVVVVGLMTSQIVFMQMMGIGIALATVIDVTIIRGILVPASMALLGINLWRLPFSRRKQ